MNNKTLAIVSYITIIGWLVSYFSYKDSLQKSSLVTYHLKQSLGIALLGIFFGIALNIVGSIIPSLAAVLSLGNLVILVLWILGIINAMNEVEKPVPVVGAIFEGKFDFIK